MTRALFSPRCRGVGSTRTYRFDLRWLFVIAITCLGLVSAAIAPAQSATVTTNKDDYVPGETVFITGSGWHAGETVTLVITETPVIHAPITKYAVADGNGNIANSEYAPEAHDVGQTMTLTATGGSSGLTASTTFTDANANLDQGKNEKATAPVDPVQWVNGNLNENQSHYVQGMSIPYRMVMTGLTNGSHTLVIGWDTRDNGLPALDYLTHYQRLEPHSQFVPTHSAETVNPLLGLGGTFSAPTTYNIPVPSNTGSPNPPMPVNSFNALPLTERQLTIYNGTITNAVYNSQQSLALAHSQSQLTITFTATSSDVVIAWGGHIAVNDEWNVNTLPTGSPYHMRLESLDGQGGNQDRSLKAGSVFVCDINGPSPVCPGTTNQYCVTHNLGQNATITWSFTANTSGASFVGTTANQTCVNVASGTGGSYTLKAQVVGADGGVFCEHTFTVNTAPVCSISGPDGPVCPSTSQQFCGPAGMGSYTWTVNGATIPGQSNQQCVTVQAPAGCNTSYTVSLTVTDGQSCPSTCQKTIQVVDTTPPVLAGVPTGGFLGCNPTLPACVTATATDNCDATPTVTCTPGPITGTCNKSQTFSYKATDDCGNSAVGSATYTWTEDTTPPTFAGLPVSGDLGCNPTAPSCGNVTASDNCDTDVPVNCVPGPVTGTACNKSQTFSYSATDDCGNTANASRTFTWTVDTTPPVLAGVPTGSDLGCNPVLPSCANATASDNCDTNVPVNCVPGPITGTACNKSQTFSYSATDDCGNTANASATFTWTEDTTPPVLAGVPTGSDLGCNPVLPSCANATASDNCDTNVPVNCVPGPITGTACNKSQTFSYSATDDCGNTANASATYTWTEDTTPPVLAGVPTGGQLGCNPVLPSCANATASDNCDTNVPVNCVPGEIAHAKGSCALRQTFTYTATDDCGNTASESVTYFWTEDTTPPVLEGVPTGGELGCNPTLPSCGNVTASDLCDIGVPVNCVPGPITGTACFKSQTFNYSATDDCGNTANASATYTWTEDTTPPVLAGVPTGGNLGCNPTPPSCGNATASDNCDTNVQVNCEPGEIAHAKGSCALRQTFTYTATDDCGNTASESVTYFWTDDTTGPDLVCPPNKVLECGDPTDPGNTGSGSATDACGNATVTFSDAPTPANCTGKPGIIRTWKAVDDCGNSSVCDQTIEFHDTTPPNIICPPDVTVECNTSVDPDVTGRPTFTDNCEGEILVDFDDGGLTPPDVACAGEPIHRVWMATDPCGNSATCTQIISFQDTHPPTIHCPTDNVVVACGNTPTFTATAEDLCDESPSVVCVPASGSTFPVGETSVVCTATDDCGNTATCGFKVTVNDPPVCSITGPTETCTGENVELCGPAGNYTYAWTGPGGFQAGTQCISVSAGGTYNLVVTDIATKCSSEGCSHDLASNPCVVSCPRTPGFWSAQCDQSGTGSQKFNSGQMTQISECVDNQVAIFNWPAGTDFSSFCATVSNGGQMNQRRQAKRQFAALLANVCTGQLGLVANNGDIIKLDPSTPVSCSGLSSTTIGALITEVDGLLLTLEGQPLSNPVTKAMYSQIIACLDAINNAENVGTVACTSAGVDNAKYRDYQTPGDGGLTDVVELYRPSPNPFNLATRIAYVVRGNGEQVDIGVFDLAGRKIRSLASGFQAAGRYEVTWNGVSDDGGRVNNGVYFVRSTLAGQHKSMRVIYVK